jgi:hypothetical protein
MKIIIHFLVPILTAFFSAVATGQTWENVGRLTAGSVIPALAAIMAIFSEPPDQQDQQ